MEATDSPVIPVRPEIYSPTIAAREGKAVEQVTDELLTQILTEEVGPPIPPRAGDSFADILAPIHAHTRSLGYSDEEVGDFVDAAIMNHRAEKRERGVRSR